MDINNMSAEELRELAAKKELEEKSIMNGDKNEGICDNLIGKYVIVRTYSAGVWFGKLQRKIGEEVYLTEARRMYRWWAAKSISLTGCALYGIKQEESKICGEIETPLIYIEILPCSDVAIQSIKYAPEVEAE